MAQASTQTTILPVPAPTSTSEHKTKQSITPLQSLLAGSIAGAVEAFTTYPFEYAKTRSQLPGSPSNPLLLIRQTISQNGISSIYTGSGALVAGTALKAGVRFMTFDAIKNTLADEQGRLSTSNGIVAGMLAGAVESVVAVTPTERIKTALIDDAKGAKRFRSTAHGIGLLVQEQGVSGLYRGLVSTTAKQSATSAVRMGSYNALKSEYAKRLGRAPTSVAETFGMGAIAGIVTVYATQPLDTIKTRSQSARGERLGAAIVGVWQQGGLKAYWRGSTMRLGRLILSGGIVFSVYEQMANVLRR